MSEGTSCIVPVRGGPCGREPVDDAPFPICDRHLYEVTRFGVMDGWRLSGVRGPSPELPPARPPVVYYVRVGDLVKIGTTVQSVTERFQGMLPPGAQILATEPGGFDVERDRHRRF